MSRSIWKPIYINPQVQLTSNTAEVFIQNRSTYISESRVNRRFQVYNGNRWFPLEITPENVGYLVGEFAPTRKRPIPKKKKQEKGRR